jgi:cyclophilin family peptidyl-prolyl cis-trans isomerase
LSAEHAEATEKRRLGVLGVLGGWVGGRKGAKAYSTARPASAVPRLAPLLLAVLLAGCLVPEAAVPGPGPTPAPGLAATVERPAIRFETEAGPLLVMLYPEAAPKTVALMEAYVREGYYVGRSFGRTVPGHVIQVADAAGGAIDDARRVPLETNATFHFSAGAVGTARDVDPNSGGPELFVMDFATSHLDGNFTVWGQVVSDLGVVHDIATRPAVDFPAAPSVPGVPVGAPFDRMAVAPVRITAATLERISLPAATAAHYPLQVARNVRAGSLRHSLEWPADLRANATSSLTWYIRASSGAAAPLDGVEIRDERGPLPVAFAAAGIYPFTWRPDAPGVHTLAFLQGGKELARLQVAVPASGALRLG